MANLTLIGMYNYDPTLFDNMILPDGIDRDIAIDTMLEKSGEFEVLYPNFNFLKMKIGTWFQRHYRTFDKWLTALNIVYNPLENYDRMEDYSDIRKSTTDGTASGTSNSSGSTTPATQTVTDEKQVSAYDSATYQPAEKNTSSNVVNTAGSDTSTSSSSSTSKDVLDEEVTHTARLHGNIGVTTSQQMLQSELDIARFNIYENIADLFIEDFCLMIY